MAVLDLHYSMCLLIDRAPRISRENDWKTPGLSCYSSILERHVISYKKNSE